MCKTGYLKIADESFPASNQPFQAFLCPFPPKQTRLPDIFSHPALEFADASLIFKPAQAVCRVWRGAFLFTLNRVGTFLIWRFDL